MARVYHSTDGQRLEFGQDIWVVGYDRRGQPKVRQIEFTLSSNARGECTLSHVYAIRSNAMLEVAAWHASQQEFHARKAAEITAQNERA